MQEIADLSETVAAHYQRHAQAWARDRNRQTWTDQPWHQRFLDSLPTNAAVLDLGCSPGTPVAAHMVAAGHPVPGVDVAPAMIQLARSRMPDQEWIVADMRTLALGRCFSGLLAWDSFFHLSPAHQ